MSYLVLARKWRPQTFSDLVGQEHVSRTLANAIQTQRVAHAFLFTGVRGVGKTTSARIMAKALNCEQGPTATPCLQCAPCREIAAGSDVDVQEIDGASYNGVDEVRRLQESLPYRPARDRYKIFIVDEVHMLSQSAWNAFLKTLEEPPPHVKFIFATTEVHKVPVTILSRCQRYDFKLIATQLIARRLKYVLEQEKIEADEAAVALIAREGAGSLRDAMSLLDQAIAWGGDKLVGEEIARVLGVAARSVLHEIAKSLIGGDAATCLRIVGQLAEQGYDIAQVSRGVLAELRDLVVAKVCANPNDLLDLADEETADVQAIAKAADADDLLRLHHGFSRAYDDVVRSADPRAALEMLLVRLARRPPLAPIDDLVTRLLELERRLSGGVPAPSGASRTTPSAPSAPAGRPPSRGAPAAPASAANTGSSAAVSVGPSTMTTTSTPSARAVTHLGTPLGTAVASAEALPAIAPVSPPAQPDHAPRQASLDAWRTVLGRVRADDPSLAAVLENASPIAFGAERVVLGYEPGSFFAVRATDGSAVELLTRHVRDYFETTTPVAFDLTAGPKSARSVAAIDGEERRVRLDEARRTVAEHPLVRAAIEILEAELRDVRLGE